MDLTDIKKTPVSRKRCSRVGRGTGSGNGKTCGRGFKGQNSRSGTGHAVVFEGGTMPLYRRLPKRGFNNARFRDDEVIVNVEQLNKFKPGDEVTLKSLVQAKVIRAYPSKKDLRLKVLGNGKLEVENLTVKAHKISANARKQLEQNKGNVEIIEPREKQQKKNSRRKNS